MTPRELYLKIEGYKEQVAFGAILNRRANTEKNVSLNSLLKREEEQKFGSWEEREQALNW